MNTPSHRIIINVYYRVAVPGLFNMSDYCGVLLGVFTQDARRRAGQLSILVQQPVNQRLTPTARRTTPYNNKLHWLPIKHRIDFKIANITFRTLHCSQSAYLRSSLHACHSTRSLRLSNTTLLSARFVRTSFGSRSFSVAAHKIWNSLPLSLCTCTSPDTFRRHLKTHYCQQAFHST